MWNRTLITILSFSILLATVGCNDRKQTKDPVTQGGTLIQGEEKEPIRGGVLKLFSTKPDTFNPLLSENIYVKDYASLCYEGLYQLNGKQEAKPLLVEKVETTPDGLVWTLQLRNDVVWHDGLPLTAEDVEFTFNTILNPGLSSIYKTNLRDIVTYAALDKSIFRLVLQQRDSFLPWRLNFPILAKHDYVLGEGWEKDKKRFPLGTGPFKFSEYHENQPLRLKANEKWWGSDKNAKVRKPYIEEIEIKMGNNPNETTELFSNSNLDVILLRRGFWGNYIGRRDIVLQKFPSNEFEFLAYGLTSGNWVEDVNVRKAIHYSIDRVDLINYVIPGEATPSDIPIFPESRLLEGGLISFSASREKAKEALEKSGWKADNQGKMFKFVNGANLYLRINLLVNKENPTRVALARKMKEQIEGIGISVDILERSQGEYLSDLSAKNFDMVLSGIRISGYPDLRSLYTLEGGAVNVAGYQQFELSNLIADFQTDPDFNKKIGILKNIRSRLEEDVPYSGLFFYNQAVVYAKRFKGNFEPHFWNKMGGLSSWFLNY